MTAASATIARHYQESHGDVWVRDEARAMWSAKYDVMEALQ